VLAGLDPLIEADGVTDPNGTYTPTQVFDDGIAARLDIPRAYLRRLHEKRPDLYDANVNGWLHGRKAKVRAGSGDPVVVRDAVPGDGRSFLVRCFRGDQGEGGIARAFLSSRYGIVDNFDILTASLDGIRAAGVEVDIDACDLTDRRMYVTVKAPQIAVYAPDLLKGYRSPFDGRDVGNGWTPGRVAAASRREGEQIEPGTEPVIFAGFVISNSEVGDGAFKISPRLVVQVCNNGLTIGGDALREVHLGGKHDDGVVQWSDTTQRKALELVTARTADAVTTFLNPAYVRAKVADMEQLAGTPVKDAVKTVETLAKKLNYTEYQQATILDHFIRGGQPTAGGMMQAVTSAAQLQNNADTAFEMEAHALRVLELAAAGGAR
jgi:hypothetical protein